MEEVVDSGGMGGGVRVEDDGGVDTIHTYMSESVDNTVREALECPRGA